MNVKLAIVLVCTIVLSVHAQDNLQTKNYDLQIGSSPFRVEANFPLSTKPSSDEFENRIIKIIQFYDHPTLNEKESLKGIGVDLLNYLPNYAWLVSMPADLKFSLLDPARVRAIIDVPSAYKLSRRLQEQNYPNHILNGDFAMLTVTTFGVFDQSKIKGTLTNDGIQVDAVEGHVWTLRIAMDKINSLVSYPFIQYIEPIDAEPTPEAGFVENRSNHRGNYLASERQGGLHYDGTGITIAVGEGGTVNPSVDNDFKGRLDRTLDGGAGTSGHKTGVAQRMAAYGNIDPLYTGMAYGADVVSTVNSATHTNTNTSAIAINHSYGFGCYTGNYGSGAYTNDNLIYDNPAFMVSYSAGNIGTSDCGYGAGNGWGTITGTHKQAKNVIAVGAVNINDALMSFSSWGPAPDGRIKTGHGCCWSRRNLTCQPTCCRRHRAVGRCL